MKIILLENVTNLGILGDVVEVKDGFARNYLLPCGKAKRATESNLREFEEKRAQYEQLQQDIKHKALSRHEAINEKIFVLKAKAGVDGKLFGSISSLDIASAIKLSGVEVKKAEILMPSGPLKTLGTFEVALALHSAYNTLIKVQVDPEV